MSEAIEKTTACPYCGCKKTVTGVQSGYACIRPDKVFTLKSQALYHEICLDCGTVLRSYVKRPADLKV